MISACLLLTATVRQPAVNSDLGVLNKRTSWVTVNWLQKQQNCGTLKLKIHLKKRNLTTEVFFNCCNNYPNS